MPRRIVVVGGGASGTLAAAALLRRGDVRLGVTIVEPRELLGRGVAYGTPDPWHRLNVPAITMSGVPGEPEHFCRFAGVAPTAFPSRGVFGAYLATLLADAAAASEATLDHVHERATLVRDLGGDEGPSLVVELDDGRSLQADAVVLATGNALPQPPPALQALVANGDRRLILDPWAHGALDGVLGGETVGVIGTGHTALDVAASLLLGRGVARVIAMSRHGEIPRSHEDPWRPRPGTPVFSVAEFASWKDKAGEARLRFAGHPLGWRQALDSLRPYYRELWLAMSTEERGEFVREHRREWEVHRSRLGPDVTADVRRWMEAGRLDVRAVSITGAEGGSSGIRILTSTGPIDVQRLVLATGPDESPRAHPLLAAMIAAGLARPASQDLGIDVDPYAFRVLDASGAARGAIYALGPIIRGSVWESIAIPEIVAAAGTIAAQVVPGASPA